MEHAVAAAAERSQQDICDRNASTRTEAPENSYKHISPSLSRGTSYLSGGGGDDYLIGDASINWISGVSGNDFIKGGAGFDWIFGDCDNDIILGEGGADYLYGKTGDDILEGGADADYIAGGDGNDRILAGFGKDQILGGSGRDVFIYTDIEESGFYMDMRDVIKDFESGEDVIDLSAIDADLTKAGKQSFELGDTVLSDTGEKYSVPGQLIYEDPRLSADVDGDGKPDFAINLIGVEQLHVIDFIF